MADRITSPNGNASIQVLDSNGVGNILMQTGNYDISINNDTMWAVSGSIGSPGDSAGLYIDGDDPVGGDFEHSVVLGHFPDGRAYPKNYVAISSDRGTVQAENAFIGNSGTDVGGSGSRTLATNPDNPDQSLTTVSTGHYYVNDYRGDNNLKQSGTVNFTYLSEYAVGGYYDPYNFNHHSNVNQAGIIDLSYSYVNEDLITDYSIGSNNPNATGARQSFGTFRSLGRHNGTGYDRNSDSYDSYQIIANIGDYSDYRDRSYYSTTNQDGLHAVHITRGHDDTNSTYAPFEATVDTHITTKKYVDDRMIISTTEPTSGSVGQQWFNPTTGHLHIYTE